MKPLIHIILFAFLFLFYINQSNAAVVNGCIDLTNCKESDTAFYSCCVDGWRWNINSMTGTVNKTDYEGGGCLFSLLNSCSKSANGAIEVPMIVQFDLKQFKTCDPTNEACLNLNKELIKHQSEGSPRIMFRTDLKLR